MPAGPQLPPGAGGRRHTPPAAALVSRRFSEARSPQPILAVPAPPGLQAQLAIVLPAFPPPLAPAGSRPHPPHQPPTTMVQPLTEDGSPRCQVRGLLQAEGLGWTRAPTLPAPPAHRLAATCAPAVPVCDMSVPPPLPLSPPPPCSSGHQGEGRRAVLQVGACVCSLSVPSPWAGPLGRAGQRRSSRAATPRQRGSRRAPAFQLLGLEWHVDVALTCSPARFTLRMSCCCLVPPPRALAPGCSGDASWRVPHCSHRQHQHAFKPRSDDPAAPQMAAVASCTQPFLPSCRLRTQQQILFRSCTPAHRPPALLPCPLAPPAPLAAGRPRRAASSASSTPRATRARSEAQVKRAMNEGDGMAPA